MKNNFFGEFIDQISKIANCVIAMSNTDSDIPSSQKLADDVRIQIQIGHCDLLLEA